jgi:hypothetical protein
VAYRRWERSGGGSAEVWRSLAVTSRGGSPAVMVRVGLTACASGPACRRRVLRPAHGGRAQSKHSGSFMGGQRCCRCKEAKGGLPCSSVYARLLSDEVRRWQASTFSEVVLGLRAREASRSSERLAEGLDWMEVGRSGRSMVVGARVAAGTLCAEGTPTISCAGGAESERGSTINASVCFIGTGAGVGAVSGVVRRGRVGPSAGVCSSMLGQVEHVCVFFCPSQALAEQPNVRISPKILCKVSSMSLGLSSLCEFQVKIWSGL